MTRGVSHNYSYQDCLDNSKKVAWKEDEVLGQEIRFLEAFPAEQVERC